MDEKSKKGNNAKHSSGHAGRSKRAKRRGGGIGPDGKSLAPAIAITAVVVILLFVAIYFGTVEGWFSGKTDPASVDATVPPEYTPAPAAATSKPISALNDKTLTTLVIDVGQGSCCLLMSPNGKTVLIDSGPAGSFNKVKAELEAQGVERLDAVFATAADDAYIGAMADIVREYRIGAFYVSPAVVSCGRYTGLLGLLDEKGVEAQEVWADEPNLINWDKSCEITVLAPIKGAGEEPEYEDCIVLRVSHKGHSVLFASELTAEAETLVLSEFTADKFRSTVLCVASNGAEGSTESAFLDRVSPKYAVISVGKGVSGCPSGDVLSRLNARGVTVLRTDKNGTVSIVIDGNGIKVK